MSTTSIQVENNQNNQNCCSKYFLIAKVSNEPNCGDITKLILMFSILVCAVIILINSFKISYDSEVTENLSNEFIENFKTGYFTDFFECNPNDEKIKLGDWQGTVKGCGKKDKAESYVLEDKNCKSDEFTLEKIPSQKIFSFKGLSICGTTKDSKSYYNLLFSDSVVEENEECPEGTKNCGYIDTINNKLCLKKDQDCPISYIQIRDKNSSPPDATHLKKIVGKNITLYYSNDPYANKSEIAYIQNAFKIADDKICALPHLYHSNIELNALDALIKNYSSDCVLKDYSQNITIDNKRFHKLSSINQYKLYEENGIIDKIKSHNLTDFGFNIKRYEDNTLNLYVRRHFGFNKSCLKERKTDFNEEELSDILATGQKMNLNANWLIGVNFAVIVFIIWNLTSCQCCKNIDQIVVNIIKLVGSLWEFFDNIYYGVTLDDPYEENMKCSDFVSNSNYNIMIQKIQENGRKIKTCAITLIFMIAFISILLIINIIEYCYKYGKWCDEQQGCCCHCCKDCIKNYFKNCNKNTTTTTGNPPTTTGNPTANTGNPTANTGNTTDNTDNPNNPYIRELGPLSENLINHTENNQGNTV